MGEASTYLLVLVSTVYTLAHLLWNELPCRHGYDLLGDDASPGTTSSALFTVSSGIGTRFLLSTGSLKRMAIANAGVHSALLFIVVQLRRTGLYFVGLAVTPIAILLLHYTSAAVTRALGTQ